MNILVDYLVISFRFYDLENLIKFLRINPDDLVDSPRSYYAQRCKSFGGINICYNDDKWDIVLSMSGKGCRTLETLWGDDLNWLDFIGHFLQEEGSHIARLDIACDDKPAEGDKGLLSMKTMFRHVRSRSYICKSKQVRCIDGSEEMIIFGAASSDRRLRIYNKALERKYDGHWIRVEFQLRNDAALSFYMRALEMGEIGKTYYGMLMDYLRFTRKPNTVNHTERTIVCRWWQTFCCNAKRIRGFYLGGLEYNMERLIDYLHKQVASSAVTYLETHDGDVLSLLSKFMGAKLNKRQEMLIKTTRLIRQVKEDYKYNGPGLQTEHRALMEAMMADARTRGDI